MSGRSARQRLAATWSRLPARERLVLSLLLYEGLSPLEAARALGCTVREIHQVLDARLPRLRARLRSQSASSRRRAEPLKRAA